MPESESDAPKVTVGVRTEPARLNRIDGICADFHCSRSDLARAAFAAVKAHDTATAVWLLGESPPEGSAHAEMLVIAAPYFERAHRDTVPAPAVEEAQP